ncbi:MAG: hypothetical protein H6672_15840 [Anaerolineaceae bacterium]|nr:hypothetical protein [Anaerolineaceae bacterium]
MTNQPEERTRKQFIVRWIVATLVGGAIGLVVFYGVEWFWRHIADTYIDSAVLLLMIGFFTGLVQWPVTLKGKVSWHWWTAASLASFIIWGVASHMNFLATPLDEHYLTQLRTNIKIITEFNSNKIPISIISFLLTGMVAGLPQWLVLRRQFQPAYRWLLGMTVGSLASLLLLTVIGFASGDDILGALAVVCTLLPLLPITYASVTGYVLFDVLKRAKTNNVSE